MTINTMMEVTVKAIRQDKAIEKQELESKLGAGGSNPLS
jgi:hypothetical protein